MTAEEMMVVATVQPYITAVVTTVGMIIVAIATERKVEASTELTSTEYIRTLPRSTAVSWSVQPGSATR